MDSFTTAFKWRWRLLHFHGRILPFHLKTNDNDDEVTADEAADDEEVEDNEEDTKQLVK